MPDQGPETGEKPPFSRIITPDQAGAAQSGRIQASESERPRLAEFYRIHDLASLTLDYRLDPLPSGCWRLTGDLNAELTQLCGVTLEPVQETIQEDVSIEFWPENRISRTEFPAEEEDILASDPPEPIVNGRIDLGHLAAEIFASAINPYPRKEGVAFDWTDPKAAAGEAASKPFAGLARLKSKE
jgi:uncharacterized metal-binding protein YceD (DUF177 family)